MDNNSQNSRFFTIFVIGIVIGVAFCIVGFLLFITVMPSGNKEVKETSNNTNSVKEITDTMLIEKLQSELTTKDKSYGLYYEEKVSVDNANDKRLIGFNMRRYLEENNVEYKSQNAFSNATVVDNLYSITYTMPKDTLKTYMNGKYNNNVNYNVESNGEKVQRFDKGHSTDDLVLYNDNYSVAMMGRGGSETYIKSKLVKVEEDNDNVYVYDNAAICSFDTTAGQCSISIEKASKYPYESVLTFTYDEINSLETAANKVLTEMSDKVNTYKHTFKKVNGSYYYVSTEVVK